MTFLPLLFGKLNLERTPAAYNKSLITLAALSFCGILSSSALIYEDKRSGGILYLPENDRRVLSSKQSLAEDMDKILANNHSEENDNPHQPKNEIELKNINDKNQLS